MVGKYIGADNQDGRDVIGQYSGKYSLHKNNVIWMNWGATYQNAKSSRIKWLIVSLRTLGAIDSVCGNIYQHICIQIRRMLIKKKIVGHNEFCSS